MERIDELVRDWLTPPVAWPVALGVAAAVVVVLEIVYRLVFNWLSAAAGKTKTKLDDVLVRRMRLPAQVLVFLFAAHALFSLRDVENATFSMLVTITELLLIAYLAIEALETLLLDYWLAERKQLQVPSVVRGLVLMVLYTAAVLSIIGSVTGMNLAPVLATSTVLTVVLGLALQDTLGNLFAGLALSLERPFAVGDWLLVDGVEGRVAMMGWRSVHMTTFTRDVVVMPNSVIAKARVQNFSKPELLVGRNCDVLVPLDAHPDRVDEAFRAAIVKVPQLRQEDPRSRSWLVGQTPLTQKYVLRIWLDDFTVHDDVESDFLKAFYVEAHARGLALKPAVVAAAATV